MPAQILNPSMQSWTVPDSSLCWWCMQSSHNALWLSWGYRWIIAMLSSFCPFQLVWDFSGAVHCGKPGAGLGGSPLACSRRLTDIQGYLSRPELSVLASSTSPLSKAAEPFTSENLFYTCREMNLGLIHSYCPQFLLLLFLKQDRGLGSGWGKGILLSSAIFIFTSAPEGRTFYQSILDLD